MERNEPQVNCFLVRDLLIPYVAGEVSQPTKGWVDSHLERCASCREALAGAVGEPPTSTPTQSAIPDVGGRLLRRVRGTLWIVLGMMLALVVAIGGLTWSVSAMKRLAEMPAVHPVPAASLSAEKAVVVDLTPLGFTRQRVERERVAAEGLVDGAQAGFTDEEGHLVQVRAYRFASARDARRYENTWEDSIGSKVLSFTSRNMVKSASKFRNGGRYYYTWSENGWLIIITVPGEVDEPSRLRDQIRDLLFIAYTR